MFLCLKTHWKQDYNKKILNKRIHFFKNNFKDFHIMQRWRKIFNFVLISCFFFNFLPHWGSLFRESWKKDKPRIKKAERKCDFYFIPKPLRYLLQWNQSNNQSLLHHMSHKISVSASKDERSNCCLFIRAKMLNH